MIFMKIISALVLIASVSLFIYGFTRPHDHWMIGFGLVLTVASLWGVLEFFIAEKKENLMSPDDAGKDHPHPLPH